MMIYETSPRVKDLPRVAINGLVGLSNAKMQLLDADSRAVRRRRSHGGGA